MIFIIIYADNLVIRGAQLANINNIKMFLSGKFVMMDMKEIHYFQGIEVIRTLDDIIISQRHYILNLFFKFGMTL